VATKPRDGADIAVLLQTGPLFKEKPPATASRVHTNPRGLQAQFS